MTETTKIDEKQPYIKERSGIIEENTKQRMKAETCSIAHSQAIEENENVAKAWFRRGPNLTVLKMGHI